MTSTHLISRLQYRVSCPDEAQAFELRHMLSSVVTQEVSAVVEELCSRYVAADEWIHISRLEIDLGDLSIHTLRNHVAALVSQQLEQALVERINNLQPEQRGVASRQSSDAAAFFFFLENGVLPRWVPAAEIDIAQLAESVRTSHPEALATFLTERRADKNIWLRIVLQLDRTTKVAIIWGIPALRAAYEAAQQVNGAQLSGGKVPADSQVNIPQRAAVQEANIQEAVLLLASQVLADTPVTETIITQIITLADSGSRMMSPVNIPPPLLSATTGQSAEQEILAALITATERSSRSLSASPDESINEDADTPADPIIAGEKLVVHTSGIVLLHPFLKPFFRQLNLLQGNEWIDVAAQQKAIHILHYLSTGRQQQPEWHLALEKIMCGLAPHTPILREVVLEEPEIAECQDLLSSVIEHWAALKSTSIAALQEVFLRRDGLLQQTADGWVLQVARKTPDVLLEALPWNLSLLKFPWTDYIIEVLWQ